MDQKPAVVVLYVIVGAMLAGAPLIAELAAAKSAVASPSRRRRDLLLASIAGAIAILVATRLPWWLGGDPERAAASYVVCAAIAAMVGIALRREFVDARHLTAAPRTLGVAAVTLLALAICGSTVLLQTPQAFFTTWHHWGAYIGPAEVMREGGRLMLDMPAQYGLGPTTVIFSACRTSCWSAMPAITIGFCVAYAMLIGVATAGMEWRSRAGLGVGLAAGAACCLLWVAYPPFVTSPTSTPSVTGLRFLPPLLLLVAIGVFERSRPMSLSRIGLAGSALYAVAALWSPESLFMSSAIWWPYYALRSLDGVGPERRLRALARALAQLAGLLIVTVVGSVGLLTLLYGEPPSLALYLTYMAHPPGAMPINWKGPVWFLLATLALGAATCALIYRASGNSSRFRWGLSVLLLNYGAALYTLGRSHDNNFINILPYCVLTLSFVVTSRTWLPGRVAAAVLIAPLLALLPLFGWDAYRTALENPRPWRSYGDLVASFSADDPETQRAAEIYLKGGLDLRSLAEAIATVRSRSSDPIEVVDMSMLNVVGEPAWNVLHGPVNFAYVPDQERTAILARGARKLGKSGWLIADKATAEPWLSQYKAAYQADLELDLGRYTATHFVPPSGPVPND